MQRGYEQFISFVSPRAKARANFPIGCYNNAMVVSTTPFRPQLGEPIFLELFDPLVLTRQTDLVDRIQFG
jgi:hypothetical protein